MLYKIWAFLSPGLFFQIASKEFGGVHCYFNAAVCTKKCDEQLVEIFSNFDSLVICSALNITNVTIGNILQKTILNVLTVGSRLFSFCSLVHLSTKCALDFYISFVNKHK